MRTVLAALVLAPLLAATSAGQDANRGKREPPGPPKASDISRKPVPLLKAGDPAPALKASKWLQGEVKGFQPGKVYVVEFWAPWCEPCLAMMPHLAELQSAYKSAGVTIIGFSAKDKYSTEEQVLSLVKKRGPKLGYTFAHAGDRDTWDTYLKAAGRSGIPSSFVVDKAGKVAWVGHPMYLDLVLPEVVKGTWKAEKGTEKLEKIDKELRTLLRTLRTPALGPAMQAVHDFETNNPLLIDNPFLIVPKISLLLRARLVKQARDRAEDALRRAVKQQDLSLLRSLGWTLRNGPATGNKELLALSLKAAKALLRIAGDKDWQALLNLAETYFALDDHDKAVEYGNKAVAVCELRANKDTLETKVKAFKKKAQQKNEEK